jgi:FkbM family methyltransferase
MKTNTFYAELNTDKYIRETFFSNENTNMTMVEIGAGPSEFLSMSKHFRDSGWRCICVEPNPKFAKQHREAGHEIYEFAISAEVGKCEFHIFETGWEPRNDGISFSSLGLRYDKDDQNPTKSIIVEVITLDNLLESIGIEMVNFVSIDVEGWELDVMKGFNCDKYKPMVILLENYNHNFEYNKYMESIGYSLHSNIAHNYIFTKFT